MAEPASQRTKIRPAAVAGSFYVGHAQRLRAAVADLLRRHLLELHPRP